MARMRGELLAMLLVGFFSLSGQGRMAEPRFAEGNQLANRQVEFLPVLEMPGDGNLAPDVALLGHADVYAYKWQHEERRHDPTAPVFVPVVQAVMFMRTR